MALNDEDVNSVVMNDNGDRKAHTDKCYVHGEEWLRKCENGGEELV
jgi:hypothetical protein